MTIGSTIRRTLDPPPAQVQGATLRRTLGAPVLPTIGGTFRTTRGVSAEPTIGSVLRTSRDASISAAGGATLRRTRDPVISLIMAGTIRRVRDLPIAPAMGPTIRRTRDTAQDASIGGTKRHLRGLPIVGAAGSTLRRIRDVNLPFVMGSTIRRTRAVLEIEESVSQNIGFTQSVDREIILDVSHDVPFSVETETDLIFASGENNLNLNQQIGIERPGRSENDVSFGQVVQHNILNISVETNINFGSTVQKQATINISISHDFIADAVFGPTTEESLAQSVTFTPEVARGENPDNDVSFTDVASAENSTLVPNSLSFVQVLDPEIEVTKPLLDNISFGQTVYAYIEEACELNEYSPFGGILPGVSLTPASGITLTCGADSIALRNPDFGNVEELEVSRALNTSRGGTPTFIRDSQWPRTLTLQISFSVLTRTEGLALLTFLKNCLGKLVTYTDYQGRTFNGIITNPDTGVIDENDCRYSADLELEALV